MFERRLKIVLAFLLAATLLLAARALQVQVFQHDYWVAQASDVMKKESPIETTRGRLLDVRGRVIAEDIACNDACVDYRAIPAEPDADWVKDIAAARMKARRADELKGASRAARDAILASEIAGVRADLDAMWKALAKVSGRSLDEIDQARASIVLRVEMRQRSTWYRKFREALEEHSQRASTQPSGEGAAPPPWYRRWLMGDAVETPQLDQFDVKVAEQTQAHVILRDISPAMYTTLWKQLDRFPGLVLRPSTTRSYPFNDTACHVIGHESRVVREDIENDPNLADELRRYLPNDIRGRSGLEAFAEPLLRGKRGWIEEYAETGIIRGKSTTQRSTREEPEPGADVVSSIDMDLQRELVEAFASVPFHKDSATKEVDERYPMLGACVLIDVPTGQVRAMVSVPTFDLNQFDALYPALVNDKLRRPLLNRATQFALEPGSTAKPMVGLAAITQGVFPADGTIECTGYLVLDGRRLPKQGRCWTMKMYNIGHHQTAGAPHPTGFLTFPEALERSCNVFFETLADKLGERGLHDWMFRFGLGRRTGLGIDEVRGHIPGNFEGPLSERRISTCFSGIGQSQVAATPIQMANVAATIARGGIWVRPTLIADATQAEKLARLSGITGPSRVDLHLSPQALAEAKTGMMNVVTGPAGTGTDLKVNLLVAGKTGTAQTAKLTVRQTDAGGTPLRSEDGRPVVKVIEPNVPGYVNRDAPWYRGSGHSGTDLAHAWYIGFAPADHPKIAFACMVEYGGSGGVAAASIAKAGIEACIEHGYLDASRRTGGAVSVSMMKMPGEDEDDEAAFESAGPVTVTIGDANGELLRDAPPPQ